MYNKIVDALKGIARDGLRMKMITRVQTKVASNNNNIENLNKDLQRVKKDIARAQFKQTQIVDADPDKDDKIAQLVNVVKNYDEEIIFINKELDNLNEVKKELDAHIEKIQNGEVKVCLDELNELTNQLIMEVTKDTAVETAKELSA